MWSNQGEGLLPLLEKWSEELHQKPGNLKSYMLDKVAAMKQEIAPFYFNYESGYEWFQNVIAAYKNMLVGKDMQDTKAVMTGLKHRVYDEGDVGMWHGSATSVIDIYPIRKGGKLKPQKYYDMEIAAGYLNNTFCLKLAICHQTYLKVRKAI